MKREGMPKKDMEATKIESPTLIPSMEDADTVAAAEAETVMMNDNETVKSVEKEGDTVDARNVPAMDASVVGTPENPVNLETGEMYVGQEDEVTEKIVLKSEEGREVDHEADTIQLEQAAEKAVMEAGEPMQMEKAMASAESEAEIVDRTPGVLEDEWFSEEGINDEESFNALMAKTELVPSEISGIRYEDYASMNDRRDAIPGEIVAAKEKAKDESSWYNSWWNVYTAGADLEKELTSINRTMGMFDGVVESAKTAIENIESDSDMGSRVIEKGRKRREKASKLIKIKR